MNANERKFINAVPTKYKLLSNYIFCVYSRVLRTSLFIFIALQSITQRLLFSFALQVHVCNQSA